MDIMTEETDITKLQFKNLVLAAEESKMGKG